jgi:hypothetical protein
MRMTSSAASGVCENYWKATEHMQMETLISKDGYKNEKYSSKLMPVPCEYGISRSLMYHTAFVHKVLRLI